MLHYFIIFLSFPLYVLSFHGKTARPVKKLQGITKQIWWLFSKQSRFQLNFPIWSAHQHECKCNLVGNRQRLKIERNKAEKSENDELSCVRHETTAVKKPLPMNNGIARKIHHSPEFLSSLEASRLWKWNRLIYDVGQRVWLAFFTVAC